MSMYSEVRKLEDTPKKQASSPTKHARKHVVEDKKVSVAIQDKQERNITSKKEILLAINIAILQNDITDMPTAYKSQTFRFTPEELQKLQDYSYSLTRSLGKKVGQGDLLRIAFLLLSKGLETDEKNIIAILQASKQ